jgi:WD40 repeat protein
VLEINGLCGVSREEVGTAAPRVLTGHTGDVHRMAVSADGRTAVSGGADGTVRVWDLARTAAPRELTGHTDDVYAVAVSTDGRTAVSGGHDGTVRVWDLADVREQARWIADAPIMAVAFKTTVAVAGDTAGQVHVLQLNVPTEAST